MKDRRLELVVMDWAGTAVDFGSMAPILALEDVFKARGIPVARSLLRLSMGLAKKDHIREVLALPSVAEDWRRRFGAPSTEVDVESLYEDFTPRMMDEIAPSATLIPGIREFAESLRRRGLKLGATTGYTRAMMQRLMIGAAEQGYAPDISVCPEDVGGGRPNPWMCFRIATELGVSTLASAVKIGDTPSDIGEGRNAGMWTIGVAITGNGVGLSEAEWMALPETEQAQAAQGAEAELRAAGAHYIINSAADALPVLDEIEARLLAGERP